MTQVQDSSAARNRWIIAALWLFLYGSFTLLSPSLLDGADGLHAEVAREMVVRGNPVTLYANGIRCLNRAPLLYWSIAGSMRVFGVGTAQARLPLAAYALVLFLLVETFARQALRSARAGLYAAVSLALSCGFFLLTRTLGPEAIAYLWYVSAIFCFWQTEARPGERSGDAPVLPCLGFAGACALGVLTTGWTGFVLPVGAACAYLLLTRGVRGGLQRLAKLHPLLAGAVFLIVAAPWHVLAAEANPAEGSTAGPLHTGPLLPWMLRGWQVGAPTVANVHGWAWSYFVGQHLAPYRNLRVPHVDAGMPLLLFWGSLLMWLMPWSVFLGKALGAIPWRSIKHAGTWGGARKTALLLAVAGLLPLLLASCTTRHAPDALVSLPFFTILIASWLDREAAEAESLTVPARLGRSGVRMATALLAGGVGVAVVCACLLVFTQAAAPTPDGAALLRHNPAGAFHWRDLDAAAVGAFRGPLWIAGVAVFGGTLLNWCLRRAYRPHLGNMALAVGALGFLTASHVAFNTLAPALSSQRLAASVAPMLRPGNLVVINDGYEAASTLSFYLQRTDLHILHGHAGTLWYGSFFRDAPPLFETDESIQQKWTGPERIFLWTDPVKLPKLPTRAYIVAEGGGKQIVSNKAGPY